MSIVELVPVICIACLVVLGVLVYALWQKKGVDLRGDEEVHSHGVRGLLIEVSECKHCGSLTRIGRNCEWCGTEIPTHSKYRVVNESTYEDQPSQRVVPRRGHFPE